MKTIAILGRQPALGIAELESLYGAETIIPFGKSACFIDLDSDDIDFDRLGGSVRIAKVLTTLPSISWPDIEKYLLSTCPENAESIDGKLSFGISVIGLPIPPKKIAKTALLVKKAIKSTGSSVRMVPHGKSELGSATVLYNKLTAKNGWELLIVSDGKTAYLAQTTKIQDIDAYSARDQARPKRDAKVGMLPPKLAQIIINLAVGTISHRSDGERAKTGAMSSSTINGTHGTVHEQRRQQASLSRSANSSIQAMPESDIGIPLLVLDAFCGTGVILQEAMLMDYEIYGSDIEPRMVEYSIDNLNWLDTKFPDVGDYRRVEIGDATKHTWDFSKLEQNNWKLVVAGETYLGQPLSSLPNGEHLSKIIYEVNLLHHKFLENIGKQIPSGTRLCLAVPTWRGKREFLHLPTLDYLADLGYTRMRFKHVDDEDLIYHRENQVVGRELLVLEKR